MVVPLDNFKMKKRGDFLAGHYDFFCDIHAIECCGWLLLWGVFVFSWFCLFVGLVFYCYARCKQIASINRQLKCQK